MDSARKTALVVGVLFIVTFVTSIPALVLYGPVVNHADYVLGAGADTRIFVGALLEVLLAIADIGTAVAIFPVIKRQNESLALAYLAARIVEGTITAVGIICLLAVVTLRRDFAGSGGGDAAMFVVAGQALVAVHKWTFLLGPGFCPGIENGLILGYLMYRSRLVPRPIAVLGLIGGPLAIATGIAELFELFSQTSATAGILTLPGEGLFELAIGIWLTVKGFTPSPIISDDARQVRAGGTVTTPMPTDV
jgi:Domain of unknown function (DUF4386)